MKNLKIILFVIIVQCILSCNRPKCPTACFTVNKSTANIGDTIIFSNCSDYDGWSTKTTWYLGDTTIINNGENIKHVYSIDRQYVVELKIGGEKQCSVHQTKIITIQ